MSEYLSTIDYLTKEPLWRRQIYVAEVIRDYPHIPVAKVYADLELDQASVKPIAGLIAAYGGYIKDLSSVRVKLGYSVLDRILRGVAPGEVLGFIARSGVGKTVFALNVIRNNQDVPTVFFSLEMPAAQVYERLAAMTLNLTTLKVEAAYSSVATDETAEMLSAYKHLCVVDKDSMTFPQMSEALAEAHQMEKQPIRLVIIDYLGYMQGQGNSPYERTSNLAKECKAFAKRFSVALIVLSQISRSGDDGGTPPRLGSSRDSGVVEESCDYLLGAWRPALAEGCTLFEKAERAHDFQAKVLKNRSGDSDQEIDLTFNRHGANLRIEDGVTL